ncbi:MAG TPA: hypothetical protein VM347_10005, partial [Nonomuraea sp.]|nr:hypothetical protein [Nonomuraea sp.]
MTDELSYIFRDMSARIAEAAPAGWVRATANGYADKRGAGFTGVSYRPDAGGERAVQVDLVPGLRRAYAKSGDSKEGLSVELTVDASGRFEAVMGRAVGRGSYPKDGFLYVP